MDGFFSIGFFILEFFYNVPLNFEKNRFFLKIFHHFTVHFCHANFLLLAISERKEIEERAWWQMNGNSM